MAGEVLTVSTTCVWCGKEHLTEMPIDKYRRWHDGEHLQKVFPEWTPDQREIVISGTCPQCWDQHMSDEDPVHDAEYHERYEAEHNGASCPECREYEVLDDDPDLDPAT